MPSCNRYGAIVLYTGNSIYRALNKALREQHTAVPRYYPYLRLFFDAIQRMPHPFRRFTIVHAPIFVLLDDLLVLLPNLGQGQGTILHAHG